MRRSAATLAAGLALVAAHPAYAAGTATGSGWGIYAPGQQATPIPEYVVFDVDGTATTTTGTGPVRCHVQVLENPSSVAGGTASSGEAWCSGAVTVSSSTCVSSRTGTTLTVACSAAAFGGTFHLMPRQTPYTIEFDVTGGMWFA
jgi:hypothetical protein